MRTLTSFLLYTGDVIFNADLGPATYHEAASRIALTIRYPSKSYQADDTAVDWRELITNGLPVWCEYTFVTCEKLPGSRRGGLLTRKHSIRLMICHVH